MSKIYQKWRELNINPFEIAYEKIKLIEIISYPPAGNDVVEVKCILDNEQIECFIKIERSKISDFISESNNLKTLYENDYYKKIPKVYELGVFNNKNYIVVEKIDGDRLSDIFIDDEESLGLKNKYLVTYGKELAKIHKVPPTHFSKAKQRIINDYPKKEEFPEFDENIAKYIQYLLDNKPDVKYDCFIHGDFHYANILWENQKISGVIDFEYSGIGFKEQDIAWSIVLRPMQQFLDNFEDIKCFLRGYSSLNSFDKEKLRWCLINAYCHFYLMNIKNEEYKNKLIKLLEDIIEFNFH